MPIISDRCREPCLSAFEAETSLLMGTTFVIDLRPQNESDDDSSAADEFKPPDWDALNNTMSTVREIIFYGGHDQDENMLKLALVIKSHPDLEALFFSHVRFLEFGHFWVAFAARSQLITSKKQLALKFEACMFESRAAKTLGFTLQSTDCVIETLSFVDCDFPRGADDAIQVGLRQNTSLRKIECVKENLTLDLMQGVSSLLGSNENLVKATLSIHETRFWEIFRAVHCNRTLESLTFSKSTIDDSSIDAILMKCFMIPSLKELCFRRSTFRTHSPFDLLAKALSEYKILDTLCFDRVVFPTDDNVQFSLPCGHLQIEKLSLRGFEFKYPLMLQDIANNPFIQSLDLRYKYGTSRSILSIENICNTLLLPNRGPSELKIDELSSDDSDMIAQALTNNTNLLSLDIGDLGSRAVEFIRYLPNMAGLRKLSMKLPEKGDLYKPFFQALVDSLKQNTTLHTLSLTDANPHDAIAQQCLPQVRYFLAINRIRRRSLMTVTVPNGIWAHVLAKTSEEAAGINYILTSKPDIIVAWSRKRKDFEENM